MHDSPTFSLNRWEKSGFRFGLIAHGNLCKECWLSPTSDLKLVERKEKDNISQVSVAIILVLSAILLHKG